MRSKACFGIKTIKNTSDRNKSEVFCVIIEGSRIALNV